MRGFVIGAMPVKTGQNIGCELREGRSDAYTIGAGDAIVTYAWKSRNQV